MTVPASKRTISDMEFYSNAVNIRVRLTHWLLRDFGIKDKVRNANLIAKSAKMSKEDKDAFLDIITRYGLEKQLTEDYPMWWVSERRRTIDHVCAQAIHNIRMANAIYPTTDEEKITRRQYQNLAIGNMFQLLEELQFVITVLNTILGVDIRKYTDYVESIESEIALLRSWRKSDNSRYKNGDA